MHAACSLHATNPVNDRVGVIPTQQDSDLTVTLQVVKPSPLSNLFAAGSVSSA
jgi:hypothetical protein